MNTLQDGEARQQLARRLRTLSGDQRALWGKFDCHQMLAHLTDGMKMMLGDLPVMPKNTPLKYWPVKQLVIYWLPFPKGAPTAPELLTRRATSVDAEVSAIEELLDRFGEEQRRESWPAHPAFGQLDARSWGVLQYRHIDHHLRQFGS